jgi:hypothetical protein
MAKAVPESGTEPGLRPGARAISRTTETHCMKLIGDFVGADDMARWGGVFRVYWVRNQPNLVEELVKWGSYLRETRGDQEAFEKGPGAWLMRHLCIAAGVKCARDMGEGPRPTA